MQDWNYYFTNDFDVTIELSCEKVIDQSKIKDFWNENKYALLSYIGQVFNIFLSLYFLFLNINY